MKNSFAVKILKAIFTKINHDMITARDLHLIESERAFWELGLNPITMRKEEPNPNWEKDSYYIRNYKL